MSEAALHPRKSCWTPASAFIFFFLSLPLLYNELRLATRDGSNPLLFSAAPQPYFRRANAWYRHLYPLQFFLSHPCYVSTDQVWHILKWVIKNGRVSFIDNEQEVLEGINKLDVQEGDGIHFSASCFMGHSWTFFFFYTARFRTYFTFTALLLTTWPRHLLQSCTNNTEDGKWFLRHGCLINMWQRVKATVVHMWTSPKCTYTRPIFTCYLASVTFWTLRYFWNVIYTVW